MTHAASWKQHLPERRVSAKALRQELCCCVGEQRTVFAGSSEEGKQAGSEGSDKDQSWGLESDQSLHDG